MTAPASATPDAIKPAPRSHSWALVGIFWIMALSVLTIAQGLIVPIITAMMLALIFSPVRRAMDGFGLPSGVSAAIILLTLVGVIGTLGYFVSGAVQDRLTDIPQMVQEVGDKLKELTGTVQPVMEATEQIQDITTQEPATNVVTVREPGFLANFTDNVAVMFGQVVICLTLAFFLIASGDLFYEKLVQVMPTLKDKRRALAVARTIENQLSAYLLTITVINFALGVAIGLTMWALGMPDPILFAIAGFLLNYIPYIGAMAGTGISFLVALVTFDSATAALVPAACYLALTSFEGQFVTPVMVGRRLKLNAVVVFVSFALWAWLWSFMGMLLSTPMLLTMKVVSDNVPGMAGFGKFLADRDDLSRSDRRILKFIFRRDVPLNKRRDAKSAADDDASPVPNLPA
ncbi:MAG: AI-2E family transporter [Hyphomonas sp.]|tara:strand:+ start:8681 stop:9889 length:1209 start_codon:yes stop_codon:yes gene_type:complete